MPETTNVKQVKMNIMTQSQFDEATKIPTELYMITDAETLVDSSLSLISKNPVQNKVITQALNNKQDKLVSGTSIKTINNLSLLGSGGITLKTINDTSLIGSGNVATTEVIYEDWTVE